MSGHLIGVVFV